MADLTPPIPPTGKPTEVKMPDNIEQLKPKTNGTAPIADAGDINSLWLDPALGDGLIDVHYHNIPVGKPKDFFRVHPDPTYRRMAEIYVHKTEDDMDEQVYIIDKPMQGVLVEARRCTLVTVIYRDGSPRLWPLKLPRDGERDNPAWESARIAAKTAMTKWIKLFWNKGAYITREARPGYAPEPDYSKLPTFDELVRLGFGNSSVIRGEDHPIVLDLYGAAPAKGDDDDGLS
jgi:hypothetical protein